MNTKRNAVLFAGSSVVLSALAGHTRHAGAETYFRGDLQHRPRLVFDSRDGAHLARVIDHIDKKEQPWTAAYEALRDDAEKGVVVSHTQSGWKSQKDKWAVLYGRETENGRVARAKAAVAWLYVKGLDPAFRPLPRLPGDATPDGWVKKQAAESVKIIEGMYDDWPCWRGASVMDRGIVAADSLVGHAQAYDFLAALPAPYAVSLDTADRRLGELAGDFHFWLFTIKGQKSNHGIRVASGLGTAAIVLNRHDRYRLLKPGTWYERPSRWIKHAAKLLHPTDKGSNLAYQLETGAFGEGTSYHRYAADLYLPFFFGYDRFLSGGGVPFLKSDPVNDAAAWSLDLRLPDGRRPVVNNATVGHDALVGILLSQVPGGARSDRDQTNLLWDWQKSGYPGAGGSRSLELLGAFDPKPSVVAAAGALVSPWADPTRFLDRQGEAVLRTSAGPDAAYCLVMARHGAARTHAGGHSSVDNGAFTFFARGDFVTIDPGYAGFTRVKETYKGEHRSLILVDGKAPSPAHKPLGIFRWVSGGEDASLVAGPRTQSGPDVRSAEVATSYEGATLRRTVALVQERYLLVEDRCTSSKDRDFTSQVQTNAGAAKKRPVTTSGTTARFGTARLDLPVCVGGAATAPLSLDSASAFDATGDSPEGHDALRFKARGKSVTFLTAIAVEAPGKTPVVESVALSSGTALRISTGGRVDVAISNPNGALLAVPATATTREVVTDAAFAIVSFDATKTGATLLQVGGTQLVIK